jgi:hypothetical protein
MNKIYIFLITHNNLSELRISVNGILKRTRYPFHLVIVDNSSTDQLLKDYLLSLKINQSISIVNCKFNLWIIGVNSAIKKYLPDNAKFFVVSDSDIIVPPINKDGCWLSKLHLEMMNHVTIGKLGLSLDLGYIKNRPQFKHTFEREVGYYANKSIGDNLIAPVDTTMAIYRTDFFMTKKPRFYPGHGVMGRPEYYICRTKFEFRAKHIGWRNYTNDRIIKYNTSKVYCFTLMGAYLDPVFLSQFGYFHNVFYKFIRPLARLIWSINVIKVQFIWFLKNMPSKLNNNQYFSKNT